MDSGGFPDSLERSSVSPVSGIMGYTNYEPSVYQTVINSCQLLEKFSIGNLLRSGSQRYQRGVTCIRNKNQQIINQQISSTGTTKATTAGTASTTKATTATISTTKATTTTTKASTATISTTKPTTVTLTTTKATTATTKPTSTVTASATTTATTRTNSATTTSSPTSTASTAGTGTTTLTSTNTATTTKPVSTTTTTVTTTKSSATTATTKSGSVTTNSATTVAPISTTTTATATVSLEQVPPLARPFIAFANLGRRCGSISDKILETGEETADKINDDKEALEALSEVAKAVKTLARQQTQAAEARIRSLNKKINSATENDFVQYSGKKLWEDVVHKNEFPDDNSQEKSEDELLVRSSTYQPNEDRSDKKYFPFYDHKSGDFTKLPEYSYQDNVEHRSRRMRDAVNNSEAHPWKIWKVKEYILPMCPLESSTAAMTTTEAPAYYADLCKYSTTAFTCPTRATKKIICTTAEKHSSSEESYSGTKSVCKILCTTVNPRCRPSCPDRKRTNKVVCPSVTTRYFTCPTYAPKTTPLCPTSTALFPTSATEPTSTSCHTTQITTSETATNSDTTSDSSTSTLSESTTYYPYLGTLVTDYTDRTLMATGSYSTLSETTNAWENALMVEGEDEDELGLRKGQPFYIEGQQVPIIFMLAKQNGEQEAYLHDPSKIIEDMDEASIPDEVANFFKKKDAKKRKNSKNKVKFQDSVKINHQEEESDTQQIRMPSKQSKGKKKTLTKLQVEHNIMHDGIPIVYQNRFKLWPQQKRAAMIAKQGNKTGKLL
ncbi:unnamed protein product [Notodromas monacha]|uniref:Uncharacterized protein n=1 Tax=Notodromas monacha TaxID=399045 RepID=A0A7R9BI03_9CRUS|nr:unnamed protein product [Notodromas monacha]CAG0914261.1 unnamed protein product [Notodromas monacha]